MNLPDTPIQIFKVNGMEFFVKREDLACSPPGPPFSKMRGLYERLFKLKETGIKTVGYTETSISMAGWGVAWAAQEIGLKAVIFDPQYKRNNYPGSDVHNFHRAKWAECGAEVIPIRAGMAKVNYHISRKILEKYPNSKMLPLGLPFEETIEQTANQVKDVDFIKSVVVCVGSGTITAGVIKGFSRSNLAVIIYGICSRRTKLRSRKRNFILDKAEIDLDGLFSPPLMFFLHDPGYDYTDRVDLELPFPCNSYYDKKAIDFLLRSYNKIEGPILFWNIGGGFDQ